jgi:hypothetical protein
MSKPSYNLSALHEINSGMNQVKPLLLKTPPYEIGDPPAVAVTDKVAGAT